MELLGPINGANDLIDRAYADALTGGAGSTETVYHGTNASTARPTTTAPVIWIGSVEPLNKLTNDIWVNPTANADFATQQDLINAGSSGRLLEEASSPSYQSGIGATATDLNGLIITFDVTTRPVLVRAYLPWTTSTSNATAIFAQITDNAGTQMSAGGGSPSAVGGPATVVIEERITTPGTYTRKVQMLRFGGSGTVANGISTASAAATSRLSAYEQ